MKILQKESLSQIRQIINLSLPLIFSFLTSNAVSFASTLMVGRLSQEALASLALVHTLMMTLDVILSGILMSISVSVAHCHGAKESGQITNIVRQGLWLAVLLCIPLILCMRNASHLFLWLGQQPEAVTLAQAYLNNLSWGILPLFLIIALHNFVTGLQQSRVVFIATLITTPLNIFINYLLIFGKFNLPELGVAGIGTGSAITYWVMFIAALIYVPLVGHNREYKIFARLWRFDAQQFWRLVVLGWPIGAMFGVEVGEYFAAVLMCGLLGAKALAAYQITMQCVIFTDMIPFGLSQGTSVLIGHANGKGNLKRVRQIGWLGMTLGFFVMLIIASIFWSFPKQIIGLFLDVHKPQNAELIKLASTLFILVGAIQIFDGIRILAAAALRGIKDTRVAMWMGIVSFWVIAIPLSYCLAFFAHWGAVGIWSGTLIGIMVGVFVLVWRFDKLTKVNKTFGQEILNS